MLVAGKTATVAAAVTVAQLDKLLLDGPAWLRMKHPSNQPVFRSVSVVATATGASVTASAFDYETVGKVIPLNFEVRRDAAAGKRTLQLKSALYYGAIPVIRENKLTIGITLGASTLTMSVDATPTWIARSLGGAKVTEVAEDVRDLFGAWIRAEGPKQPK